MKKLLTHMPFVFLVAILLSLTLSIPTHATESYLCISDFATGFQFNKSSKQWKPAEFISNRKYVLSKLKSSKYTWELKEVGESYSTVFCKDNFNEYGFLICKGGLVEFRMSNTNLRFLKSSDIGYWDDNVGDTSYKEGDNDPYMEIGKCSPL